MELRDIDSGSKVNEKFRTDEAIESVFTEQKSFLYLYAEDDNIVLMEPNTFSQMEVSKDWFGKTAAHLKEDMKVTLHLCDGKPTSASVPKQVTTPPSCSYATQCIGSLIFKDPLLLRTSKALFFSKKIFIFLFYITSIIIFFIFIFFFFF